jgi:large subunit ribosomal protein L25
MIRLHVQKRNVKETKAKVLLREGTVPGILYGPAIAPQPISVGEKDFERVYNEAGETSLISLEFSGAAAQEGAKEENVVLIRDAFQHPVTREFLHVDFYQLPLDRAIEISVPVEHGAQEAPAVKEQGGILVQNIHEVDIKALPKDLIHTITVDLSSLKNFGDAVLVKDLPVPQGVEILTDTETSVFTIEEPHEEEEEEIVAEGEEDQISGIKTEAEEKREEEGGEETAGETEEESASAQEERK